MNTEQLKAKREGIKGGMVRYCGFAMGFLQEVDDDWPGENEYQNACQMSELMFNFLDSLGVVIADESAELPENPYPKTIFPLTLEEVGKILNNAELEVKTLDSISGPMFRTAYTISQREMIEAGYKRVYSLKEE